MNNKIITSEGNVQFQYPDGGIVNVHPSLIYTVFNEDTVSFMLIPLPKSSGLAIMASKAKDLELNGTIYSIDDLPNAIAEAFSDAGAQARAEIVDELPTTGKTNTIYLVPKEEGEGYDEYIYLKDEQRWELIGDTSIEIKEYVKKADFSAYTASTKEVIDFLSGAVDDNASDIQFISGAVDTEISNREAADAVISGAVGTLSADLANEVQRAISAETELNSNLEAEVSARTEADSVLSSAIDTVVSNLASEVSRAESAETELSNKIDAISGDAEDIQAELDVVSASLESEVSARTEADDAFDARLDEDEKVIGESLNDLNTRMIANEAADTVISGAVDTLSTNLANEVQRAISAEDELSDKIDAVSGDVATISGSVESLGDDKANKAEAVASAEYVSSSTTIDLKDISGNVISQVDASDFIIDGMIDDVRIENGYLIIDFNTASGKEDIQIPLTDIFDPSNYYDKTAIDNIVSGLNDSIDTKLDATAYTPTDLSNYYTKSETSGATEIQNALDGKANSGDIKTFVAGRGISITTSETADTVSFNLPIYLSGSSAVAIGQPIGRTQYDNKVSGFCATAIGAGLKSLNSYETATGVHNIQRTISNVFGNSGSTLFTIGNGAGDGSNYRHNALDVRQNGDIYIADTNDTSTTNWYEKPMIKLQDALGQGGGSSYTAGDGIDITNDVISVTGKADTSAVTEVNDVVTAHTADTTVHVTSAEKATWNAKSDFSGDYNDLSNKLSAGTNITIVDNVISATGGGSDINVVQTTGTSTADVMSQDAVTTQLNNKANKSAAVGGYKFGSTNNTNYLQYINVNNDNRGNEIYYPKINGKGILTNNSTWAQNNYNFQLVETSAITTAITSSSTDAQVPSAKAVNDKLGGLNLVKLSQSEYDALATKDSNTLYVIVN